ncbi:translocation/assembly module TamB domain-containing protein [Sphingomonas crusticola]|uniref:translocation/assembly module TamB domain-containing protein n=1 Tax=Sphingomonas crusticola TaxID=1697973 RepID=UPI000E28904B|nr:translocation/assembly module TamB domain-containing protein [Sphingomonas crusticola]
MADDVTTDVAVETEPRVPRRRWRVLRALGIGFLALVALFLIALWSIDTQPGHRLIADRIAAMRPTSGLRIKIGRIEGSIWRRATLRDVRLYDLKGQFFEAPEIRLDWHPLDWAHNLLNIEQLSAPLVILDRLPALRSKPGSPILPGFDIHIGALQVDRLKLGRAVAGHAEIVRLAGKADIHGRRAMIGLRATSTGRDRLLLDLDAEPDGDKFRLKAELDGPAGGVVAGLAGLREGTTLRVGGHGTWHAWDGAMRGTLGGKDVADLGLGVRNGRYSLAGTVAPSFFLAGKLQRLTAPRIKVAGAATLADRKLDGRINLASPALQFAAAGGIDLGGSAFSNLSIDARLLRPPALFPNMTGRDVHLHALLDGPFRTTAFRYSLSSPHIAFDTTGFDNIRAVGEGRWSHAPVSVPIRLQATQVTGLGTVAGGILRNLSVAGVLKVDPKTVVGNDLSLNSDKLKGKLQLRLDLVSGRYDIAVAGGLARYLIPGLGIVDVQTKVSVLPGPNGVGTIVSGTGQAIVRRFDNAFLASLAGGNPRIDTRLVRTPDGVMHFSNTLLTGPAIRILGAGIRRRDGTFQFAGAGTQTSYGPFRIQLDGAIDHPKVQLQLDRPVEALGLTQVALNLDPVPEGFQFRAAGGSLAGPFQAHGLIRTGPNQPTMIEIADLAVSGTHAKGVLTSGTGGFTGRLDLAGGGIGGSISFAPQGALQRIEPHLTFAGASIAAAQPIRVRRGRADGAVLLDPAGTVIDGSLRAIGLARSGVSLARIGAEAHLKAGQGTVAITAAGTRRRAFDIAATATLTPGHMSVTGKGNVEGKPLTLAGPVELTMTDDAWTLAPARIAYAGGEATLSGRFGRNSASIDAGLEHMPLALLDIFNPNLGLGGYASGKFSFRHDAGGAPTGRIDVAVRGITRSGLVLSSQPVDLGLAAVLTERGLAGRAVVVSNGKTLGRGQARIAPLPPGNDILARLLHAPLFAQIRYAGPADTLWRLIGVETIDLSGPLSVAADIGGTPADPKISGRLASDGARIESAVTGTVIDGIKASGSFDGSRLNIDQMTGRAGSGGTVRGRGSFDFGAGKGLGIDLAIQAQNAVLLNRDDIGATVTGPLTLKSNGVSGTIAGDLQIEKGRFKMGSAAAAQVPRLKVVELNRPDDDDDDDYAPVPWTLDLKAHAPSRLMVTGMGLDSEWRADLTIKGAVDNPAIGGRADLVRGGYQFAGRRFNLDRGSIRFTGEAPADPVLDITALADIQGLNATIHVTGTGLHPDIAFQSTPALPEDELLSRLLFGTSITNLSAPEALQLAAAVAGLRGGSGGGLNLDPINAIRKAVHLDRLRILPADVTTGQKSAIAAGKNVGRRTYVELITDGAGYSATSVEFRITRWLSVLSTISTIGRQSVNLRVSKDY